MGCCQAAPIIIPQVQISPIKPILSTHVPQKIARKERFLTTKLNSITERYEILRALGSGSIGTLYHAKELKTGVIRTIREVSKSAIFHGVEVFQEVNILRDLDHPNILKIFEAIETTKSYYIVLENISGGTLSERYKKIGIEGVCSKYVYELFAGLNYLHNEGIVHCNLAPEYVVLSNDSENGIVKIIGFTNAQRISEKKPLESKNIKYGSASPEVIKGDFSEKSDIWSAGVILYYLLTQRSPFPKGTRSVLIEAINNGDFDFESHHFQSLSENAQDLIKSILKLYPEDRPSCDQILQHSWFFKSKQVMPITYNIAQKIIGFNIRSPLAREMLTYITSKFSSDHQVNNVVNYFKAFDLNNDGRVSKEEILTAFSQIGLNLTSEIDFIMENLDADNSGFIDYTELILALTDWPNELKKKKLRVIFECDDEVVSIESLKTVLPQMNSEEWSSFNKKAGTEKGKVSVVNLKKFLRNESSPL